jgi:hypothetical protein
VFPKKISFIGKKFGAENNFENAPGKMKTGP